MCCPLSNPEYVRAQVLLVKVHRTTVRQGTRAGAPGDGSIELAHRLSAVQLVRLVQCDHQAAAALPEPPVLIFPIHATGPNMKALEPGTDGRLYIMCDSALSKSIV